METSKTLYRPSLPIWKFYMLVFCTCGLYQFWWFHKAWSFWREANGLGKENFFARIVRVAGTAMLLVNVYFSWKLISGFQTVRRNNDLPRRFSTKWLYFTFQVLCLSHFVYEAFVSLEHPRDGWPFVISFIISAVFVMVSFACLVPLQQTMNDYWTKNSTPDLAERRTLGKADICAIVTGILFWGLSTLECLDSISRAPAAAGENDTTGSASHERVVKLNNEGVDALNKQNFKKAEIKFQQAMALDPDYQFARENLAITYNNLALQVADTSIEEACKYFRKAIELDPSNEITKQNLKELEKLK